MPATKFSLIRYRVLDKCFRNPVKRYQIQDLIDACNAELSQDEKGISRRTIYYDIEYMKSLDGWDAPIITEKNGNRRYYRYSDPSFSIDNMPISEAQLKQIQGAIDLLNSFEGLPQFEGLEDSLGKMGLMVMNAKSKRCISFEQNEYLSGKEHITTLFNAIQYDTVLKINYKPFGEDACDYYFHPQFLKQYNGRWYVLGMSETAPSQIWNLALDRIQSIESVSKPYTKLDIDWDEYFCDVIGITNKIEDPVEDIHFIVHGRTANYVHSKPFHGEQYMHWIDENNLDVHLKVKINYELKRLLLSYASEITILSPQSLVDEHKAALEKALKQYV